MNIAPNAPITLYVLVPSLIVAGIVTFAPTLELYDDNVAFVPSVVYISPSITIVSNNDE
jgi:hypothetical protein